MGHQFLLFLLLSLGIQLGFAQDERYFRQILSGELPRAALEVEEKPPLKEELSVKGPSYRLDLNGDGIEETLRPEKRNGVDFLVIKDSSRRTVFETKLFAMGAESHLYKIRLVHISPKVKTLILFLDEGFTQGLKFESTARIFLLTFENNDLSKMTLTSGPHFHQEKAAQREQYMLRDYQVNVYDINNDGVREIAVQYNHIQRILKYVGRGEWQRI